MRHPNGWPDCNNGTVRRQAVRCRAIKIPTIVSVGSALIFVSDAAVDCKGCVMHGVINRAVERFVRDTYGRDVWLDIMRCLDLGFSEFEAMLSYDAQVTPRLLGAVADRLKKTAMRCWRISAPTWCLILTWLRFGVCCGSAVRHSRNFCIRLTICPRERGSPYRIWRCRN